MGLWCIQNFDALDERCTMFIASLSKYAFAWSIEVIPMYFAGFRPLVLMEFVIFSKCAQSSSCASFADMFIREDLAFIVSLPFTKWVLAI